ncbi:hypothetical protein Nepgr_025008 [Nepenthes gracilis]|uniref:intramembrane prenyl-peptidase Rce1 n=1 Tax=Nepenthes gracilis TaxID=150966 RepID=A0AAD3T4A2_NEPGR|nr:hypothetical protein Nepgr_025008 [Nepenthes gracilis]
MKADAADAEMVSKSVAVIACTAMSVLYVGILYSPTLIFRLPQPTSFKQFLIRRFICAAVSSLVSLFMSSLILLHVQNWKLSYIFDIYGVRVDHFWRSMVLPLLLTSLMYAGSLLCKFLLLLDSWREHGNGGISVDGINYAMQKFLDWMLSVASNVAAWRTYVVAPITEELVFRACMIPLLLCGGFKAYHVVFLSPIFFSLAHLNHFLEFYSQKNHSLLRASLAVGLQLGYTVIFGSYGSFLFIRTGHLIAPLAAHIFCNFMGLPLIYSNRKGLIISLTFVAGAVGFAGLLFPLTSPDLYNFRTYDCRCWHGYCSWK